MDLSLLSIPVFVYLSATIFNKVCVEVTKPFIDEIFHLRQCQVYCRHDFFTWDDKITTPPGLYLLGTVYSHILRAFGVKASCGQEALRSSNLVGGVIVLPLVLSTVKTLNFWKINIVSLPLLYAYYFFFYTDVWSTLLVVACVLSVAKNRSMTGAILANILGFSSLWFRQTNIVWIAFAGLLMVDMRRRRCASLGENVVSSLNQAFRDWKLLVPFCVNGVVFAAFVKVNGCITFGDKENHQVTFHLVQVFYCFTFLAFFTLPVWIGKATFRKYLRFAVEGNRFCNVVLTIVSYALIRYVVHNFTVVHPFLLADNRHYTFYIYRRILSRPYANVLMVPIYHFATWVAGHMLILTSRKSALSMSPLLVFGFFTCVALTLIPSPLFEPRYYIVPLVLFRMFTRPETNTYRRHLYEFLWYTFVNMVFFTVFFSYEFSWMSEPGTQRVIW